MAAYFARAYWLPPSVDLCFTGETNIPLKEAIPLKWGNTDVIFAFDQSGSMAPMIDGAKADAQKLMRTIAARFGSERFGVAGFSDYIDFPYRLYQPLTDDLDAVQAAIEGLTLVDGGDLPEAYGRMMYESYADPTIGWRADSWR
ncbi:MAG: VWA domain-containing protein, partial [Saprospiraceae bacterium]|nr:VWA domain-containing protein [Saprospiraceae bacterium]